MTNRQRYRGQSTDYGGYRYFFNGQESDGEVYGSGGLAAYEFRQYDTRLGRWWGIDRKVAKYPSLSPYQFCAGNPVWMKDVDGSDFVVVIDNSGDNKTITVQMNIYTSSREAYEKLLPAVEEIKGITKKVTIDDVEYTIILKSHDTAAYYYFIKDTLLHSEISSYPIYSDVLLGEIVEPLATGGMIICSDPPCEPLELNYKKRGTYCRLFKLCIDYLLFDDEVGNILAQSYSYTINTSPYVPENIQNLKILIGDISGNRAFVCPLKVVRKDSKLLTALPYSVVNLTGE